MGHYFKYQLIKYINTYKFIPPFTIYLVIIVALYAYKNLPILSSFDTTMILTFLIASWITATIINADTINERHMFYIHLGNKTNYFFNKMLLSLIICLFLVIFSVIYPVVTGRFDKPLTFTHIFLGLYTHIYAAILAIIVTFFILSTKLSKFKFSWLLLVLILLLSIISSAFSQSFMLLNYILPPISKLSEVLSQGDDIAIGSREVISFIHTTIYSIILLVAAGYLNKKSE